jgi:hypothetical protein
MGQQVKILSLGKIDPPFGVGTGKDMEIVFTGIRLVKNYGRDYGRRRIINHRSSGNFPDGDSQVVRHGTG